MTMMKASIKNKKNECEQMVVWRMREETNQKYNYDDKVMIPGQARRRLRTALLPPPPTPSTLITHGLNPPSGINAVALLESAVDDPALLLFTIC